MDREVVVAITGGKLDIGPGDKYCYGESDRLAPCRLNAL
jgi:hypothetical protein